MKETYGPRERIRQKKEFDFLYKNGNRCRGKYFTLVYLDNSLAHSRLGVVASRKVGQAVRRNKVKRRMRELFRRNKRMLTHPMDLIAIAKKEAAEVSWGELQKDFFSALRAVERRRPGG